MKEREGNFGKRKQSGGKNWGSFQWAKGKKKHIRDGKDEPLEENESGKRGGKERASLFGSRKKRLLARNTCEK